MQQSSSKLALLKAFCWLSAGLYPAWSLFMGLALPGEYDSPLGRSAIGAAFVVLAVASSRSAWIARHFEVIVYGFFYLVAAHFWFLVYKANLSIVYLVGSLIVAVCYNLAIDRFRPIVGYSLLLVGLSVVVSIATSAPLENKLMLLAGIVTVQVTTLSSATLRLKVLESLEKERLQTMMLKQTLLERDLESAEAVQKTLLIEDLNLPELQMKTRYQAAGKTGGDWFGHYHDKQRSVLFFWIGDVTGHGISSALVTGVACGALYSGERRADALDDRSSTEDRLKVMAQVVNQVIHRTGGDMWMTMLFCALDLTDGKLSFVNAGHPFPILKHRDAVLQLCNPGSPLGHTADLDARVVTHELAPGDTLFLYTDGLIENGLKKGNGNKGRMLRLLRDSVDCHQATDQVFTHFAESWKDRELEDDVSVMALTFVDFVKKAKDRAA